MLIFVQNDCIHGSTMIPLQTLTGMIKTNSIDYASKQHTCQRNMRNEAKTCVSGLRKQLLGYKPMKAIWLGNAAPISSKELVREPN